LTGCIEDAVTPSLASLRSVGIGSLGSSSAYAGNPSRLITTTLRRFCVLACRKPVSAHAIRTKAHNHCTGFASFFNRFAPGFQGRSENSRRVRVLVWCSPLPLSHPACSRTAIPKKVLDNPRSPDCRAPRLTEIAHSFPSFLFL
jgi:hypothetical protein